ncbi:MAG: hypothetical protein RLZZ271_140 [Pseudomonadota bacterium]|jgi:hypothetical protein
MRTAFATHISPGWLGVFFSPLLTLTWLPGDHRPPWANFESEAWVSGLFLALSCFWLAKRREAVQLPSLAIAMLGLSFWVWMQWICGQVYFLGVIWTPVLALVGCAFCVAIGASLSEQPQRDALALSLFAGFLMASLVSVIAQSEQYFGAPGLLASIGKSPGRPAFFHKASAYLGQPNLLGTLHLMSWTGCVWMLAHRKLRAPLAAALMCICLLGLALTGSRTGMLSLLALCAVFLMTKQACSDIRAPVLKSAAFFVIVLLLLKSGQALVSIPGIHDVGHDASSHAGSSLQDVMQDSPRLRAWRMFLEGSLTQFWTGFGWDQSHQVYLLSPNTQGSPTMSEMFVATHNLILDLALYCGWPLAIVFTMIVAWQIKRLWQQGTPDRRWFLIALIPLGIHSMLELPHHYLFFLLPAGLMLGMAHPASPPLRPYWQMSPWTARVVVGLMVIAWGLTVYDYVNIRHKRNVTRFEIIRIKNTSLMPYPDTFVLTHQDGWLDFARAKYSEKFKPEQLAMFEQSVMLMPTKGHIFKLAILLSANNQPDRAKYWLSRACAWTPPHTCPDAKQEWQQLQEEFPEIAHLSWPTQQ